IARRLCPYDAQVIARPVVTQSPRIQCICPSNRMFGIEVLIRRHITEHIQVAALWPDATLDEQPIVLDQMPKHKARIEECLLAAVPMAHKWDVALLRIAESSAGKCLRWAGGILFVDGKLWVVRRRINVVIAVLIVQRKDITEIAAGIGKLFHPFPTTCLLRR